MKKILPVLLCFIAYGNIFGQINAKVDERYELTSITFALAGVPEYCQCGVVSYFEDIITSFEQYVFSEPINFVRELNQKYSIGYNAVPSLANLLEIKNGKISINSKYTPLDIEKILDFRWTKDLLDEYIEMLNVFYQESNFSDFFKSHEDLYKIAEINFNKNISAFANKWFYSFFGIPYDPDIKIYISLVNGPSNYAIPKGIVLGISDGMYGYPEPNADTYNMLIHELCHHYTNPIFLKYWDKIENAANIIYSKVSERMYDIGYNDAKSCILEWFNQLCTLMYFKECVSEYYYPYVSLDISKGFFWMQRSVEFMDNFYNNRNTYNNIEDFMPQIVNFLNFTAENISYIEREFDTRRPYITNICFLPYNTVDATELILTFSEPMLASYGFKGAPEGANILWFDKVEWIDDKNFKIYLTKNARIKGELDGLKLSAFVSKKYFGIDEKCSELMFKCN